jgi:transcriptional regulator with XRE-family HTH domain
MTQKQLMRKLELVVECEGTQRAAAEKLGITQSYLSDILNGRRDPGEKLLTALGLERETRYRAKAPPTSSGRA